MPTKRNPQRPSNPSRADDRPKRLKVGGPRDLTSVSGKDPNYHYHIFVPTDRRPNRVLDALESGYEHVKDTEGRISVGDGVIEGGRKAGSNVVINMRDGSEGYLMRIPKEVYENSRKAYNQEVDATEESIFREQTKAGRYGEITYDFE